MPPDPSPSPLFAFPFPDEVLVPRVKLFGARGLPAGEVLVARSAEHVLFRVGPWTIAMLMRNPELMCLDTIDDPEFVHELMRFATEFAKRMGEAGAAVC